MSQPRFFLIIPAAGSGRRMQAPTPKQYLDLHGKPLLQHTLERLDGMLDFSAVVLAVAEGDPHISPLLEALSTTLRERLRLAPGGAERSASVLNALEALRGRAEENDWVLVHDAVRPCVRAGDVHRLVDEVRDERAGGLLALPVRDTVKRGDTRGLVEGTVSREGLWLAATPQMFRYGVLCRALAGAAPGAGPTDEAAAVEALGLPVRLVQGHPDNIKLTYPEDLVLLGALLGTG